MKFIFTYTGKVLVKPDYTAHSGKEVIKLAVIASGDEAIYKIRAEDGWEGYAFESELKEVA